MGFSLAWTSLFFREGLFLNAIIGGSGKVELRVLLFQISFQCFLIICFSLWILSQNYVMKTNFFLLSLGFFLNRICCLWLNFTELYVAGLVYVCSLFIRVCLSAFVSC